MDFEKRKTLRALATAPTLTSGIIYSSSPVNGATGSGLDEVSDSKQEEAQATLVQFKGKMPEEERERLQCVKEVSTTSCRTAESLLPNVNLDSISNKALIGDSTLGVLKNVIQNINTVYDVDISTQYLDSVTRLTKYVPLLSAVYNYLNVCCKVQEKVAESDDFVAELEQKTTTPPIIEEFYISLLLILIELVLLPVSVGYRPAFVGTRYIANYGLVRVRHIVGLRIYSIFLSVVHWALRGTIEGAMDYIIKKSSEVVREYDNKEPIEFDEVEKSDLTNYNFLKEQHGLIDDLLGSSEDPWDTLRNEFSEAEGLINSTINGNDKDSGGWFSDW